MSGDICGDNRFEVIEKCKQKLIEATNIETSPDEMAVLDSILFRFWQMGWLPAAEPEKHTEERTGTYACDPIDRWAALDCVSNSLVAWEAYEAIEALPAAQPEPHWIPCSESLPEEAYPVIVTWKNDDPASYYQYILGKHYVGVAHYKNGKWFWYSSVTEDTLMEYGRCDSEEFDEAIECIAWMPLPAPYKEDTDD